MGHARIISPTWEDIVDQPLFDNRHINHPNTHNPWHKSKSPFHKCSKLQFIHNLLDGFDINRYSNDPSIPIIQFKTVTQLQQQFPNVPNSATSWQMLLDSISDEWKTLIRQGNQTFDRPEFLAVTLDKDQMGKVDANVVSTQTIVGWSF